MSSLTVEPEDSEANVLGKTVSDLQENIVVGDTSISGTLKHATDYNGYSSDTSLQEGNFLVLKFEPPETAVSTTVELVGGTRGPVELDEDLNCVFRIANNRQKIKVVCTLEGGDTITNVYKLNRLTLLQSA